MEGVWGGVRREGFMSLNLGSCRVMRFVCYFVFFAFMVVVVRYCIDWVDRWEAGLCEPEVSVPDRLRGLDLELVGWCRGKELWFDIDTLYEDSNCLCLSRYSLSTFYLFSGDTQLYSIPFRFVCRFVGGADRKKCWLYSDYDDSIGLIIHVSRSCVECRLEPDTPYRMILGKVMKRYVLEDRWIVKRRAIDSALMRLRSGYR